MTDVVKSITTDFPISRSRLRVSQIRKLQFVDHEWRLIRIAPSYITIVGASGLVFGLHYMTVHDYYARIR